MKKRAQTSDRMSKISMTQNMHAQTEERKHKMHTSYRMYRLECGKPTCIVNLFFFQESGDTRDLHSFPTRRSSDLSRFDDRVTGHLASFAPHAKLRHHLGDDVRSEEHTSELQSHSDLVCRLLLEKKNTRGQS